MEFECDIERIQSEVSDEWFSGQKHQSWKLILARLLLLVWNTFAKYGRVNEDKLEKIWEILKECVIKIALNADWMNYGFADFLGKDNYEDITPEDWERFAVFISDKSGSNLWRGTGDAPGGMGRYSDASKRLVDLLLKAYSANTPEEKLLAMDQILNFVHGGQAIWQNGLLKVV